MNQNEELLASSADDAAQDVDALSESTQSEQQPESQEEALPEKFKGKSTAEIARAALEAEKVMHERAVEASSFRRQLQETQQRIAELQAQISRPSKEESDPLEEIAKTWDEDPKQAMLKTVTRMQETLAERERRLALEMRSREGAEFYYREKSANPDFAQREADMIEVSRKYGHIAKSEYANSKEAMELLYYAARGMRVSDYEKAAVEKARKQQEAIKDEKRKAVSERAGASSTSSSQSDLIDLDSFARLTPQQMQEELERSARRLGRL